MAHIQHKNGRFVAETEIGTVERRSEYPNFVYYAPDDRTTQHPIGLRSSRRRDDELSFDVNADGVTAHNLRGAVETFPWRR